MDKKQLWQAVLGEIEVTISKSHFVTWFSNTYIESVENGRVVVIVPNGFSKEWLENKYGKAIRESLFKYYHKLSSIEYKVFNPQPKETTQQPHQFNNNAGLNNPTPTGQAIPCQNQPPTQNFQKGDCPFPNSPQKEISASTQANLNHRYVFENLIVGSHNELARAACEAVAKNPGQNYNPLFIYGGVGLGKTHLLQAVGNYVLNSQKSSVVKYVTSEKFTNDLIDSIKKERVDNFKNHYKQIDVLLIDDIQFIGGKEKTQEEFFHIFNALYQENKQIVLCSDRPPKSIATLEERLRSRFEGGMIVDVVKPDLETRIAILAQKSRTLNFPDVPLEVLTYIAENIHNNVRELEGVLNKLVAHCQLKNYPADINNAKEILEDSFSQIRQESVSPNKILDAVSKFYNLNKEKLIGKERGSEVMKPRQIAIYLIRKEAGLSYPSIGKELGGRDHTTIMHAFNKIKESIKTDTDLKQEVSSVKELCF